MPFFVMGACEVIASVLVLLLPETYGRPLPNTIEDSINISKKKNKFESNVYVRNENDSSNVQ